jgi:hypothetical protein
MPGRRRRSFLEHLTTLVLLGVLAGAVGGLGIGYIMGHKSATGASTSGPPSK